MGMRTGSLRSFYVLGLAALLLAIVWQEPPARAKAQVPGWSVPETIPGYDPETWSPILVADQNRTVHAFSSQPVNAGTDTQVEAVFYNRWTLQQGWTFPTDILLSPIKDAQVTDAILEGNSTFHVVFFGGDNTGANIYYSKAPADRADDPSAWSAPVLIGENAGDPAGAVFYQDSGGALYVMYNGRQTGSGLYVVSSKDHGDSWSDPISVFLTGSDVPNISLLHVIKDDSGWFHAIWLVSNIAGQGRGIFYARSRNGIDWSAPVLLASATEGLGPQAPTIIEYHGALLVVYIMTPKLMMQRSNDNGQTWDDPTRLFPRHVGANGSLSLIIDSTSTLHLLFGQRITGNPDIHGMWHSTYQNGHWLEPEAVASGPLVMDKTGATGFDPFEAHGAIVQGNVILATWITERGSEGNGVWFSYKLLDSRENPAVPIPLASSQQNNALSGQAPGTLVPTDMPALSSAATAEPNLLSATSPKGLSTSNVLLASMIASLSCIVVVFVLKARHTRS
jgi:hypothetical protein